MVSILNPFDAENYSRVVLDRAASPDLQQHSPLVDRFPAAIEGRVRSVFHLRSSDRLPLVGQNALRDYHAYLARFLSFPFRASFCEEMEPLVLDNSVVATGLCDPAQAPLDITKGILCKVDFRNKMRLPLALLKVDLRDPNGQMIGDYWYWFWNCR